MLQKIFYISLLSLLICSMPVLAQGTLQPDTVKITDFGVVPDSRKNIVPAVQQALEVCNQKSSAVLVFPKGRYDFWPQHAIEEVYYESNTTDNNPKCLGMLIREAKNLTIDGRGSSFIFHGKMQPFTLDHSNSVTLSNINIDWDIPLTAQAEVIDTAKNYVDIRIDGCKYPYLIENNKMIFSGEGWKGQLKMVMEFDKATHLIAQKTGDDAALGKGWKNYTASDLGNGLIRLTYAFTRKPSIGNILVLRHSDRDHAGIFVCHSKNILLENVNVYHSAGLGILSQFSENLTFSNVNLVPNSETGRYFSGHDDGLHFSGCRGKILVDDCRFAGLMDDPINVHGIYVKIIKKLAPNKLLCRFMESMSVGMEWARPGEQVSFIDNKSLLSVGKGIVAAFVPVNISDFEISFQEAIPDNIQLDFGIENSSWTPEVTIQNSYFGSCRARGILVTTPKKVVIEKNTFESSGSAILIAGDVNSWYESGAVTDVLIKENKFLDPCLTSNYQFSEAIISIFPEVPELRENKSPYHKNIRILQNEFHVYDYPVLFAQSVNGLTFENNHLSRSYAYRPFHRRKHTFSLIACKNVVINNNIIDNDLLGKNINLQLMSKKDIRLVKQDQLNFN
ncbi:MAG: hypothetical protein ACK5HT_09045 [Draconibacterium sp.]